MNTLPRPTPLVVVILDGWGVSFIKEGNAIAAAETPTMNTFARYFPSAALFAAGMEVGLPWGEVGNSETGHRNIGAGTVQYQERMLIDKVIEDGSFFKNKTAQAAIAHVKKHDSNLHLMGLTSPGGVHAHIDHLIAFLKMMARARLQDRVFLHLFADGRDAPPQSALLYLKQLEEAMATLRCGTIASVMGRFYGMDRNKNWERTEAAYNLLIGTQRTAGAPTAAEAIQQSYDQGIFDEMIPPTAITSGGEPLATIKDNDAVIFFNFRPDRARQLTQAFVDPDFKAFPRQQVDNLFFATLTQYDPMLPAEAMYQEATAEYPLARVISEANLRQLHIAETEKYAHVTYYLNVGNEQPYPGEKHVLIPSADIPSFADKPAMAAQEITDRVVQELQQQQYDVYFINYANADMVGHTGNFAAAVIACSFVDSCLNRLWQTVQAQNGALVVTADHGNAEEKLNPGTHTIETDHTSNPVPLHYVTAARQRHTPKTDTELTRIFSAPIGVLADVAPTILDILHLPKPAAMTGFSLLDSLQ